MKINVKQVQGLTFLAKGETNHWVSIDGPKQFHGSEAASRPMELLLISLGSCTGSDVVSILQKKRVALDYIELNINGEQSDTHPKIFTKIHVEYIFYGEDIEKKDVEQAINLTQNKYCPISAMLNESSDITHSYQIKKNERKK
jgi:putative redox protein